MAAGIIIRTETIMAASQEDLKGNLSQSLGKVIPCKSESRSKGRKTSRSKKSASVSTRRVPRLYRTLSRGAGYHEIRDDDLKYIYASRKLADRSLDRNMFERAYAEEMLNYDYGWVIEAKTFKGVMPVGVVYGIWLGDKTYLGSIEWLHWSSKRNILEGLVSFLNGIRKHGDYLFDSTMDDKDFYVHICKYGILRRVGTIESKEKLALFQTRSP